MKILIVSLLKRRLGEEVTASRSRIIYQLSKGLINRGHEVTILGTGDSVVSGAKIIPIIPKAIVDLPAFENPFYAETAFLVQLAKKIEEIGNNFDIIHNHTYPEFINLLVSDKIKTSMVTTVHGQATEELDSTFSLFPNTTLIALSKAHMNLFKKTKFKYIVYNGINTDLYSFSEKKGDYLLWLGRLSKAKDKNGNFMDPKGIKWAIELARKTGENLLLSGNVEDMEFYNKAVLPFLNDRIKWYGPVSQEQVLDRREVIKLMQEAKSFLMTINWEEPFGLTMIEAMACGTPVIAYNRGSVPEIIRDGLTGFVIDPDSADRPGKDTWVIKKQGIDGLVEAVKRIGKIDREACRKHVEENFTVEKMVENYEKIYQEVIKKNK